MRKSTVIAAAAAWDRMSAAERTALWHRDRSMRDRRYAPLVERMARSDFDHLTPLQQEGVADLMGRMK